MGLDFFEKPRRLSWPKLTVEGSKRGLGEHEVLLGTSDSYVEESALFVDRAVAFGDGFPMRKYVFLYAE